METVESLNAQIEQALAKRKELAKGESLKNLRTAVKSDNVANILTACYQFTANHRVSGRRKKVQPVVSVVSA